MESSNIFQTLAASFSSSALPFPFVGITVLILIYVVILYLIVDFNENYRLFTITSQASRTGSPSGLSLDTIKDLPWFECERNLAGSICAVCLDGVKIGNRCRNFPGCKHVFHARCIDLWLLRRLTCPTCRSPFGVEPISGVV